MEKGYINGDALFTLGGQAIQQVRQVGWRRARGGALRGGCEGRKRVELVIGHRARIDQQAANERALAIVHRATNRRAQQFLGPIGWVASDLRLRAVRHLGIAFAILAFHRHRAVVVDHPALAL